MLKNTLKHVAHQAVLEGAVSVSNWAPFSYDFPFPVVTKSLQILFQIIFLKCTTFILNYFIDITLINLKKIAIHLLEHNFNSWFKEHLINPEIYII